MILANSRLRVQVLPPQGGGIGAFEWLGRGEPVALMRPCDPALAAAQAPFDPNLLGCYPLVPWSNRIAGGGFDWRGRRIALSPNRPDDPYPIHGSGWQRAWRVVRQDAREVELECHAPPTPSSQRTLGSSAWRFGVATETLDPSARRDDEREDCGEQEGGGYAYLATLAYILREDALEVRLRVTNTGDAPLPFGLGLHPFFPLHGGVLLQAPAQEVWSNDGRSPLPTESIAVPPAWDFRTPRELPAGGLNHAFRRWNGLATIAWPALELRLHIASDADAYVLYVPGGGDFFCFEPVDHPINAVHLPGGALAHGMTELAPGAALQRRFAFRVEEDT